MSKSRFASWRGLHPCSECVVRLCKGQRCHKCNAKYICCICRVVSPTPMSICVACKKIARASSFGYARRPEREERAQLLKVYAARARQEMPLFEKGAQE